MLFSPLDIADTFVIGQWPLLGVKLPKALTDAIDVFDSIRYTEVHQPTFVLADVTPANAAQKLKEYAEALSLSAVPEGRIGGSSVLQRAKTFALTEAAHQVNAQARLAVPEVIEKLTPAFDKNVEAYADAVEKLPADITSDTLLNAGPEAVSAYQSAEHYAAKLNQVDNWVATLVYLSGRSFDDIANLRVLRPETRHELSVIDQAAVRSKGVTVQKIEPVFVAAVREGIRFGINTPQESEAIRDNLSAPVTAG